MNAARSSTTSRIWPGKAFARLSLATCVAVGASVVALANAALAVFGGADAATIAMGAVLAGFVALGALALSRRARAGDGVAADAAQSEAPVAASPVIIEHALNVSTPGVALFDAAGALIFRNDAFHALVAERREVFVDIGLDAEELGDASLFEALRREQSRAQHDGAADDGPFRLQVEGAEINARLRRLTSAEGETVGFVGELHDVSQEVALEKQIGALIAGFKDGDIYSRLNVDDRAVRNPFLVHMAQDLNGLLDVMAELFSDIDSAVMAMVGGDVTFKLTGEYGGDFNNLKESLNQSMETFEQTLVNIGRGAKAVGAASRGVATSADQMRRFADDQAASLQETSEIVANISTKIQSTAGNLERTNALSEETARRAEGGRKVVAEAATAMGSIKDSSARIDEMTNVIEAIAFQTNLLALNAAVEAARAGEAGRGFSVVAQEVRNLATRSSDAARSIQQLMLETGQRVSEGSQRIAEATASLDAIVAAAAETASNVAEIRDATQDQTSSATMIVSKISEMESVTRGNLDLANSNAGIASGLQENVQTLDAEIGFFIVSDQAGQEAEQEAEQEADEDAFGSAA